MKVRWLAMMACGSMAMACDDAAQPAEPDVALDTAQVEETANVADADAAETSATPDTDAAPDTSLVADTSVAPDTEAPDSSVAPDTSEAPRPHLTFTVEPFTVASGKERQVCKTVTVPADGAFDVVRFDSKLLGISHHFNLYKVIDDSAFNPVTPDEAAVHDCSPAAEQLRGDAAYIFGSAGDRVMETPPGVAFNLKPGQRLILEYHALNYTLEPVEASLQIDLTGPAAGDVIEHHADIIWFANWGFALPPGQVTSDTASCALPYDVEIFGLMSHFHELGTNFVIDAVQGGQTSEIYTDNDWQHPKYQSFSPTLSLAQNDRIQWTCTWNNTRGAMVLPNKGSKDEMCMVFAAAYPKVGLSAPPIQCNVLF